MAASYPDLKDRPIKDTVCLFDVDGTLTPARRDASPEMLQLLAKLRHKVAIGFVSSPSESTSSITPPYTFHPSTH